MTDDQYRALLTHIRIVIALLVLLVVIQLLGSIAALMFTSGKSAQGAERAARSPRYFLRRGPVCELKRLSVNCVTGPITKAGECSAVAAGGSGSLVSSSDQLLLTILLPAKTKGPRFRAEGPLRADV
jgi:hypothetical protein